MNVLVTGVSGQLGHDVMKELRRRGHDATGTGAASLDSGTRDDAPIAAMSYVQMDITDRGRVERVMADVCPDAVIHCAAWTAVDAAEEPENQERVYAVNVAGTENLARACLARQCKMLYVSTDYVFNGGGKTPQDPDRGVCDPLNVYGRTKLEGERAVSGILEKYFIVRTAWVFGRNGDNFVRTMLRVGRERDTVRVVSDQIGAPTYTADLARLLLDMIETEKYGCFHATNEGGYISRCDFAREIFRQAGYSTRIVPVTTAEFGGSKAARPLNGMLDTSKLKRSGFDPLPDWRDALSRYLCELLDKQET